MFGKTLQFLILFSNVHIYFANPFPDFYDDYSEEDLGPAPGLCDISAKLGYWGKQIVKCWYSAGQKKRYEHCFIKQKC